MVDNGWSGNLLSEYEGPLAFGAIDNPKDAMDQIPDQLRRHHIMLRNILGY